LLGAGIKKGKWPEMIMVFPNGGHSTFYKDSYDGKFPMETIFIKEFIPFIDANFRTIAEKKGRCIEGFSMGGRGSTRLAVKYPELFCSLFCQAGNVPATAEAFDPEDKSKHPNSYLGPDKQNYIDNDVYLLTEKNINKIKDGKLRIQIACGTKDMGHLKTLRIFHDKLLELKIDHIYLEIEGLGHKKNIMRSMYKDIWFDYHVESLKRSGALPRNK
jgi:S-formylglutathione hydrolase FrmB